MSHTKNEPTNPFQIGYQYNESMKCYDVVLMVGNFKNKDEAKRWADFLANWMVEDQPDAWKQRVQ